MFFQGRRICRSAAECKDKDMGIASNREKADVPRFDRVPTASTRYVLKTNLNNTNISEVFHKITTISSRYVFVKCVQNATFNNISDIS